MLTEDLKRYAKSGVYPFHMPGHKRQPIGELPYQLDLTEIPGFDYLHDPQGCIRDIEHRAERLYQAERAFLLINGATGGILAAVRAMTRPRDKVIVARNCHRSVFHAIELCDLEPVYYLPDPIDGTDIYGGVNPFLLDMLLREHPDAKLVILTSPTYEGVVSEIKWIAPICHRSGVRLLVDEAHGAHFPFSEAFPKPAVQCGADVAVVSLHKTLPAPTQTALLLTSDPKTAPELQRQLAVFESASPSYLLMSGAEDCLRYVENHSFKEYLTLLHDFYRRAKSLQRLHLLFGDTKEGFHRLWRALKEIDAAVRCAEPDAAQAILTALPEKRFDPGEMRRFETETVPLAQAAGTVSADYVYAYPPGIPYLVPGEVVSAEMIDRINALREAGVEVLSTRKTLPEALTVIDW